MERSDFDFNSRFVVSDIVEYTLIIVINVFNIQKNEIVVVGDQLMTDVLGGNVAGLYTILVVPIVETDGFWTRFNRRIERRILSWMKRKGKITWEEGNGR